MSLLWTAELRVGLAPEGAVLARTPRGFGKAPVFSSFSGANLETVLSAQPKVRTDLHVVLSNHYLRYAVLPWSAALKNDAEWQAFATHAFETTHGRAARDWTITCAPAERGAPRLACAVDTTRISEIRAACERLPHIRLVSIKPYLAAAFERMRSAIDEAPTWLAVIEEGRAVLALVAKGRWIAVRARGGKGDAGERLGRAIAMETSLLAPAERAARVLVVGGTPDALDLARVGLPVVDRTLPTGAALSQRSYSLAMA